MMPSTRRSVLAAALAATAGCTDLTGDDPTPTETPAFGTPTETDDSPEDTPTDAPEYAVWSRTLGYDTLGLVALGGGPETPVLFVASGASDDDVSNDHALQALSLQEGTEQWRLGLADPVQTVPQFVRADGPDYVFATGRESLHGEAFVVHAIDPSARERVWRFDTEARRFLFPLDVQEGRVFVGQRDDQFARSGENVYALDAGDGEELWRTETGDVSKTGSATRRDTLLVDSAKQLEALDVASGDVQWRVDAESQAYDNRAERVFVQQEDTVRGIALADGSEIWRREFDISVSRVTSPRAALSDRVYVGDRDGRLLALSPLEGTTAWTLTFDAEGFRPTVERTSDRLYVGGAGVHAVDPVSGDREWAFTPDVEGFVDVETGAPSTVFATSLRSVWALDPETGDVRWEFSPGGRLSGVATAGDFAWVGAGDAVYALDGSGSA